MPSRRITCPFCRAPLERKVDFEYECLKVHGSFVLRGEHASGAAKTVRLEHKTTGLRYELGTFTAEAWARFLLDEGLGREPRP